MRPGRSAAALLTAVVAACATACTDPELEARVRELEHRLAELETQVRAPTPAAGTPAALPPVASPERENAAALVLREAAQGIDALDWEAAKTALARLRAEYGDTRAAKASARLLSEVEAIGKPEAPLEVDHWLTGSADELASGRATIYLFWEAWCSHCQRDMPRVAELYERNRAKGLRMVGITRMSKGVTEEQAQAFLRDLGVRYPNAKDVGDTLTRHYHVTGIPAAAIVKDGAVVWRGAPHKLTDALVQRWL